MSDEQQNAVQSPTEVPALRKQEEPIRPMEPISLPTQTPEEIQQMLHELRGRQIELEKQNEELRTAHAQIDTERIRYFDLYNEAPVGYCTLSEKELVLEANLTAATLLGVTRNALVKQSFTHFVFDEDHYIYHLYRQQLFKTGELQECELRLVRPDNTFFWASLTLTACQTQGDPPVCHMMVIDITKRKRTERELFFKENIIKSSSCAIATCDLEGNMTYGNPFFLKLWKFNDLEDFLGEPFQNFWMLGGYDKEVMKGLQSEGTWAGELKGIRKDGSLFDVQVSAATVLDDTGNTIALTSTSIDITDRKRAEQSLKESELRARAMLQAIPDMMFRFNSHGVFLDFKADTNDLYAQDVPTIIGKCSRDILPPEFVDLLDEYTRTALETGSLQTFEYQLPIPGQGVRDYECRMISSAADEVTAIVRDITERKHHEQQLSTALREKEVLLREVHHRVKNNLAAIISLMDMQQQTLEDPNGQIAFIELRNRIRSMSLVHEKLYRADSLASIDFHGYIQALISHLRTTYGSPDITCRIEAPGVILPLELASPCGLIVNELVTNALKYAFPDSKPRPGNTDCQILVFLHRERDTYTLTVYDNGIGWPPGFDWTKTQTLGMTLVRMLGQHQLGGRYIVNQENGTSITLTFADRKKEVSVHG